ncbi:unnamed protein product [Cuscuta campestris]|uniref:Uncharacterized protein n=1 Tax=Cuscuta campestris TaxID=132261 RepID=A0A484LHB0_9ASTE|nr:unnamed protein product [Cuscuta campestris]
MRDLGSGRPNQGRRRSSNAKGRRLACQQPMRAIPIPQELEFSEQTSNPQEGLLFEDGSPEIKNFQTQSWSSPHSSTVHLTTNKNKPKSQSNHTRQQPLDSLWQKVNFKY